MGLGAYLSSFLQRYQDGFHANDIELLQFSVSIIAFHGVGVVGVFYVLRECRIGWNAAFGFCKNRIPKALKFGALTAILVLPVVWGLHVLSSYLIVKLSGYSEPQTSVVMFQESSSLRNLVVYGFCSIAIAPVIEELVFRGVFYTAFKQATSQVNALILVSLLFAISHGNLASSLPLFVLSLAFIWVYERTDSIIAPIITHALFNAANFFLIVSVGPLS